MKRVQAALRSVGIPVFAGAWKTTAENATPPQQYLIYIGACLKKDSRKLRVP